MCRIPEYGTVHVPYGEYQALLERLEQAERERDAARAHNVVLVEVLRNAKRSHRYCEDSWYSCPLAPEGCADDREVGCNCGAVEFNAKINVVLSAAPDSAYAEWQAMRLVCEEALKAKWKQPDCAMPPDFWYAVIQYENHQQKEAKP